MLLRNGSGANEATLGPAGFGVGRTFSVIGLLDGTMGFRHAKDSKKVATLLTNCLG
jgi:hypothetical protein